MLDAVDALTESGTAAEALTSLLDAVDALTESGTAAETLVGLLDIAAALAESGTAAEAVTDLLDAVAALVEVAAAIDALDFTLVAAALPISDVSAGMWEASTGSDLYAMIDEVVASDADYIYTRAPGACIVALESKTDPAVSTGHIVLYRARSAYGEQVKVSLYETGTLIAEWTDSLTTSFADYSHTLSGVETDAITDYAALRLHFTGL